MWVFQWPTLKALMARIGGSDTVTLAPFAGAKIGLLNAQYAPTPDSVYTGDVAAHEANFTGYAHGAVTFGAPFRGQNTFEVLEATAPVTFTPTDSVKPNTIFGWFLLGSDSVTLLAVEMFNVAIPLPDANHSLSGVPIIGVNSAQGFGSSMVSS
jgi:hypothetical protein